MNYNQTENQVIKYAKQYQSGLPTEPYKSSNVKRQQKHKLWYLEIASHASQHLWPQLIQANEQLISYWPAQFLWGESSAYERSPVVEKQHYLVTRGAFGTGYLCLTLDNLHIISLKKLTDQYPMFPKGIEGFFLKSMDRAFAGKQDNRLPMKRDLVKTISIDSILGCQITQNQSQIDELSLTTTSEKITIKHHFSGHLESMVTAIAMVKDRVLHTELGLQSSPSSEQSSVLSIDERLKKLKHLADSGLITQQDYETKKREILSNL